VGALYTKVKEGSDQEIMDLLEEGKKHWRQIAVVGVKTVAACLGELSYLEERLSV